MDYEYWKIEYTSCEGNYRWTTAKCPSDWEEWQVERAVPMGSMGDEVAEIISVTPTFEEEDCMWEFE